MKHLFTFRFFTMLCLLGTFVSSRAQNKKPDFERHFTGTLNLGAWVPTEELQAIGVRPFYGGRIGFQILRGTCVEFYADHRFLNYGKDYEYVYRGVRESDNYHRSFGTGLQVEQKLLSLGDNDLGIMLGLGYDRLYFKNTHRGFYRRLFAYGSYTESATYGGGLYFDHYLTDDLRLGFYASFNFLNYNRKDQFNYNGDVLSIGVRLKVKGTSSGLN